MNKSQMIDTMVERRPADFPSRAAAERSFNAVLSIISDELVNTGSVTLVNFGTFTVVDCAERQAVNPQTGEPVIVPAHRTVRFKPGTGLKKRVN